MHHLHKIISLHRRTNNLKVPGFILLIITSLIPIPSSLQLGDLRKGNKIVQQKLPKITTAAVDLLLLIKLLLKNFKNKEIK